MFSLSAELFASAPCTSELKLIPRGSYQHDLLEMTFAIAARGRNDTMRFGSVITDPMTREVLGASWNRISQPGETKGYLAADWEDHLSPFAKRLIARGLIKKGFISLNTSIHAEQGALLEALQKTDRESARGLRLNTIGVTPDLKIGVATEREWTCMRCALWIDIFQPQTYELFSGGFRSFGTPREILSTALQNHKTKQEGYWKRVYTKDRKQTEPDVYLWVDHKSLIDDPVPKMQLSPLQYKIFRAAYKLATNQSYKKKPMVKLMNFGSVLINPRTGKIIAEAASRGGKSSERLAIEKALAQFGANQIKGSYLYTVGVDPSGWVGLPEDRTVTFFGDPNFIHELGIVFHELTPEGFRPSAPTAAMELQEGRLSVKYWRTLEETDERVTSPFRYIWVAPPNEP